MVINFGGKDRGFQWGTGCLEKYCDAMECDVEDIELAFIPGRVQIKAMTNLLLASMTNYAELNDLPIDFNYRKIQAWLDEAPQDTLSTLLDDFNKSKYLGKTIQDYFTVETIEGEVKKK